LWIDVEGNFVSTRIRCVEIEIALAKSRLADAMKSFRRIWLHSCADGLLSRCCPTIFETTTAGAENEGEKTTDARDLSRLAR